MKAELRLTNVSKSFNRRGILTSLTTTISAPGSLAVTGRNGSGKSTLVKIVAGVMTPTKGSVELEVEGSRIPPDEAFRHLGFVAPYLSLYDEFTARENIALLEAMRSGRKPDDARLDELFDRVGLSDRQHDRLGTYSSGMKQRVKYIFALVHNPALLILDEPTSNLDREGCELVEQIVLAQKASSIVVVATNEASEAAWCEKRLSLTVGR